MDTCINPSHVEAVLDALDFRPRPEFSNYEEMLHAREWADYKAMRILRELPEGASRATSIAALRHMFPALGPNRAARAVDAAIREAAERPIPQFNPDANGYIHKGCRLVVSEKKIRLRRKAIKMYLEKRAARPKHDPISPPSASAAPPSHTGAPSKERAAELRDRFLKLASEAGMLPPVPDEAPDDGPPLPDVGDLADLTQVPGLVGAIVDWMEASAERPKRPLYLAAALTFVGTLAGRKFASPTDLRTNQYFVTLAPSGHGKDHPIRKIKLLAEAAGLDRYIGPARIMSASALRNLIKREPAVACYIDEFAGVLRQIHDRRAGLHNQMIKHDLLDLFSSAWTSFSGAEYAGEAATKVVAPNLSLSGTSTPDDFWASLTSLSTMDGLLARFILINVTGPKAPRREPTIGAREVPPHLVTACRELAEAGPRTSFGSVNGNAPEPVAVRFDGPGAEALERFTSEMDAAEEGGESPLTRVREHAIKLALTVAVGVNPAAPVITAPIFEWAGRLALLSANTLMREARDRIADNEREAAYNKVLGLIRKAGKDGITEGVIRDRCRGVDKRVREQIIEDLIVSGRVRREKVETGSPGRPPERLVAA